MEVWSGHQEDVEWKQYLKQGQCGGTDLSCNPNNTDIFFPSKARVKLEWNGPSKSYWDWQAGDLALKFSMDKSGYFCISTEGKNLSKMVKKNNNNKGFLLLFFFPFPKQKTYFILNSEQYSQ